ncbi:MAG: alpha/beta hydrolase [Aphanocapsa sp. GSE-SYN-MK-11-07L]|jgi:pimeloyl-ACP methyl ester carboxylesterase|nr:alpha/beta hydrolase [Aphanocapsa sp. GSE-SYN-MK-11-07L]
MINFQPLGFEQHDIDTRFGKLAYYTASAALWHDVLAQETEQPKPVLIFLHSLGGGSSAYEWSKVYPAFASTHRVIVPDLIGWGSSAHPQRDYRVNDYWLIVSDLIQQVAQPPVAVVASSLTGGIMIRMAIQQPELFKALCLVCPSGYADFGTDYGRGLAAQVASIPGLDQVIYALGAANELAVRGFLQQVLFAQPNRISDQIVQAYLASAQQPGAEYAALASLRGDLCFDLGFHIQQLTVPTVILWGEQARFTSAALGKRLAQLNPKAVKVFQAIADAGVLPHLELPEVVVGLMQRHFLPLL